MHYPGLWRDIMFTTLIDTDSLQRELENPDWLICDCRYDLMNKTAGENAFNDTHIPGAVYVDLHDDLSGPPVTNQGRHPLPTDEAMQSLFRRLGITPATQVVVYDNANGSFAARLWWMLRHMQHERVAVLDGGWQAWLAEDRPVSDAVISPAPSTTDFSPRSGDVVAIDQVFEHASLVDSRDGARYRGEMEPIDKAAGHIPGARNRFWKDNLDDSGHFKSSERLRAEFNALLGQSCSSETVFYCGSGVTACHNLLAAYHAGLEEPKLYAGSWSEWSAMPGRPVATGNE